MYVHTNSHIINTTHIHMYIRTYMYTRSHARDDMSLSKHTDPGGDQSVDQCMAMNHSMQLTVVVN